MVATALLSYSQKPKAMYIQAASSITTLDTFGKVGFSRDLMENQTISTELVEPTYKEFIPASLLRRTPKINKMALACMEACLAHHPVEIEAIIVGTGLGCLNDTGKFLGQIANAQPEQMLSPTAFIQSGHNAISGQMALLKKNHGYNMTYAQGALSFEYSLKDALLCLSEGQQNVLVGAVDEKTSTLDELAGKFELNLPDAITEGASFFVLDCKKQEVKVKEVLICEGDWQKSFTELLAKHNLDWDAIDHAFVGHHWVNDLGEQLPCPTFEYTKSCGRYLSSSAFGMHLAYDFLFDSNCKYALVINRVDDVHTGIIMLEHG